MRWKEISENYVDDLYQHIKNKDGNFELTQISKIEMPTWCVHFSPAAKKIAADGFQFGSPLDIPNWGMSHGADFATQGYNFAIETTDENALDYWAGSEGVVFRTTGVRAFHYDDFHQVMFWGPDAIRPMYVIQSISDGTTRAIEDDYQLVQVDSLSIDNGPVMPLYDLLDAIESGVIQSKVIYK